METNLKKWIVYCTTNIVNNKIYIGVHKTENYEIFDGYIGCNVRINNPSSYQKPQTPFQFAVKKYGVKNFKRAIIQANLTKDEAFALEEKIVNLEFVKRKDTYNVSIGGNGGKPGRAINQFDFSGKLLKKWDSITEACEFYNVSWNSIYNASFHKISKLKYYWSFDENIDVTKYVNAAGTKIFAYDCESGDLIDEYESYHAAAKCLGIKIDSIQRATKAGYKTHNLYFSTKLMENYTGIDVINIKNKTIYLYDLNGHFVQELKTTKECTEFFNVKTTCNLRTAIRSNKPYKGFQISLEKLDNMNSVADLRNIKKKVGEYSLTGDLLNVYETVTQAREKHGAGVSRCLRGQQKTCHNLIFKYIS